MRGWPWGAVSPADCPADKAFLCDAATAARQLVVNAETDPARLPGDRGNGLFELPATMLARSDNALVFRCVPGPGVGGCLGAGEMESGSIKPTGAFTPLHTVAVEIRPLQTWISVKRARINATDEEDVTTTPLAVVSPDVV